MSPSAITSSNAADNTPEPIAEVTVVNEGGGIIGHKPRRMLQKTDVPHGVFVLIVTPGKRIALSNLAGKKLSATAVTLCQRDELADDAARRALKPRTTPLHHLGDVLYRQPDGHAMYTSAFYGVMPLTEHTSYTLLTKKELDTRLPDYTAMLQFILHMYLSLLPV